MEMLKVEIWVVVDQDGDCEVGTTKESASERFNDDIGFSERPTRMIKLELELPAPSATIVKGTISAEKTTGITLTESDD